MLKNMKKTNIKGFSLIELMVVVAIIGILAAIAVPNFQRFQRKARQSEARSLMGGLATSLEAFRAEWEYYSGALEDLGFSPVGTLRYNVGFGDTGNDPGAAGVAGFTPIGLDLNNTNELCVNATYGPNCTGVSNALPGGTANPAGGGAAAATYTAGAGGAIGGVSDDHWTMDQNKLFTNTQNGTL